MSAAADWRAFPARARLPPVRFTPLAFLAALCGCASLAGHPHPDAKWLIDGKSLSVALPAALPEGRPLRIAVYGDAQGDAAAQRAVVAEIRRRKPDLVIFTGDACDCLPAGHLPDWGTLTYAVPFWPQAQRGKPAFGLLSLLPFPALWHETVLRPLGPPRDPDGFNRFLEASWPLRGEDRVPFVFVPGNHDLYHAQDRADVAAFTGAEDGERLWRSVDVGRFRIVVLDSGDDLWGDFDPVEKDGAQLKWLDGVLKDAGEKGLATIVCAHFPPYSSASLEPPSPSMRHLVAEQVVLRHPVPLFLSGHAHAYERIDVPAEGRTMTCIVTGGAGGKFTAFEPDRAEPGSRHFVPGIHHFVMLEVGDSEIRGKLVPVDAGVVYRPGWHEERDEFVVPIAK